MTVACRTQGICSRAVAALREGHEEEVAADVGAEDGEEVGAAELAVAEGLDGGGGFDAEARVVIEEAARGDEQSDDDAERGQGGSGEEPAGPSGFGPGGKEAATDGNAAACAEEGLSAVVVGVGTRTARSRASKPRAAGGRSRSAVGSSRNVAPPVFGCFWPRLSKVVGIAALTIA